MTRDQLTTALVCGYYVLVALCAIVMATLVMTGEPRKTPREHLCSVAEISPDMTQKEREHCRLIRGHKL